MLRLIDFIALQAVWFACVVGAAHGKEWLGPSVTVALFGLHLRLFPAPKRDVLVVACVAPFGLAIDSAQAAFGWIHYRGEPLFGVLAPLWIAALWVFFPLCFNASLGWMRGRPLLAAVFGAVGGPFSYFGGERLGALEILPARWQSFAGIALAWGCAMPIGMWIAQRVDRGFDRARA